MRVCWAALASAGVLAACQPDSDKTNPAVATNEAAAERQSAAPAAGANSFTEGQAREHVTKAGYTDVSALTQAADGTWQGSATKDGAAVTVVVDYQGNVTTQAMPAAPSESAPTPPGSPTAPATPPQQ